MTAQVTPPPSDQFEPKQPGYNTIYEELASNDEIVGFLAYCIYKKSKTAYIKNFTDLNNRPPNEKEIKNHVECSEKPSLELYRQEAERTLKKLLTNAAHLKEEELEEHFKQRLWNFIHKHEPDGFQERAWIKFKGLMFGGFGGVFGNLFTTFLIIIILYFSSSSDSRDQYTESAKSNLVTGFAQAMGFEIEIVKDSTSLRTEHDEN